MSCVRLSRLFTVASTLALLFLSTSVVGAQVEPTTPPTGLETQATDTTIVLAWTDNATNESAYHVERKIDQWPWRPIVTLGMNSAAYTDSVEAGHTYCYRVYATSALISGFSNEVCTDIPALSSPPPMPVHVKWLPNLVLTWDDGAGEVGYHIECDQKARASIPIATVPANTTVYQHNKTHASLEPCCTVTAYNQFGPSLRSDKACLQP